jgi:hypothetical protein
VRQFHLELKLPELLRILLGSLFTLATAYAIGRVTLRAVPMPHVVRLGLGGAILSTILFGLMSAQLATPLVFGLLGAAAICTASLLRKVRSEPIPVLEDRTLRICSFAILTVYAVFYGVHALTPEIQPDATTYHLGLVAEAIRHGGFPGRVGFYEMLPQGAEMLYAFAFAFGKHSAAKLVHFGFLIATIPLIMALGKRLGLDARVSIGGTLLYCCAPVTGIVGTSAYNDAMQVFFVLMCAWCLLAWQQSNELRYLWPAGIAAGFCYAIKVPGLLVCGLAVLFVLLAKRRVMPVLVLSISALAMVLPWLWRGWWMTGNPMAPLFNRLFPNPYFSALVEQQLSGMWKRYEALGALGYIGELTIFGRALQGLYGPVFLLAPLGLLALRRPVGRILWIAAATLAIPWYFNVGARFLLPAMPFVALALAASLPRIALPAVLVLHALAGLPPVLDLYSDQYAWKLRNLPWKAALRIQPEREYLQQESTEFYAAWMVDKYTKPGERVLDLRGIPYAYSHFEPVNYWHHLPGIRLSDALRIAGLDADKAIYDVDASWPEQALAGVRLRLRDSDNASWKVLELQLQGNDGAIPVSREWKFSASSNPWGVPAAFDGNLASGWTSFEAGRSGMYVEVMFDQPIAISGARVACLQTGLASDFDVQASTSSGEWKTLAERGQITWRPRQELRLSATRLIKKAGIQWVLVPIDGDGMGSLGKKMVAEPAAWGLEKVASVYEFYLMKVK